MRGQWKTLNPKPESLKDLGHRDIRNQGFWPQGFRVSVFGI